MEVSIKFNIGKNVTDLVQLIVESCPWIRLHRRERKRKETVVTEVRAEKKMKVSGNGTFHVVEELKNGLHHEKFIGKFEVNVLTLQSPAEEFLARPLNYEWVSVIKNKIKRQPQMITTIFPVLIDINQVTTKDRFKVEELARYNLWTLGGNHVRTALQQLALESNINDLRNVNIHLYAGLNREEGLEVANLHNGSSCTLKPTFQDSIYQSWKLKEEDTDKGFTERVAVMLSHLEMKEVSKESIGTIVSVGNYSDKNKEVVKQLFKKYEHVYGANKTIPQTLFKELQGVEDDKRLIYLQKAMDSSMANAAQTLKNDKKRGKLREAFLKIVDCSTWDVAVRLYKEHTAKIDEFLGLEIRRNEIPKVFIDFCQDALEVSCSQTEQILSQATIEPVININIDIGGKDMSRNPIVLEIIHKYSKKIEKEIVNKQIKIRKSTESQVQPVHDGLHTVPVETVEDSSDDSAINLSNDSLLESDSLNVTNLTVEEETLDESLTQSPDIF